MNIFISCFISSSSGIACTSDGISYTPQFNKNIFIFYFIYYNRSCKKYHLQEKRLQSQSLYTLVQIIKPSRALHVSQSKHREAFGLLKNQTGNGNPLQSRYTANQSFWLLYYCLFHFYRYDSWNTLSLRLKQRHKTWMNPPIFINTGNKCVQSQFLCESFSA